MKFAALLSAAFAASTLAGCAVVPYGGPGVVYAAPAPPPLVVVRPSYGYYGYRGYYGHRGWR